MLGWTDRAVNRLVSDRGYVLLSVFLLIVPLALFSQVSLRRTMTELQSAETSIQVNQAFHLAEAGVDNALSAVVNDLTLTICPTLTVPGLGVASCTLVDPGNNTRVLTVTASVPDAISPRVQRSIEVVLGLPPQPPFQQTIYANQSVDVKNGGMIDSYDSTLGDYTPAPATGNRGSNAIIRTDSIIQDYLTFNNNVILNGDAVVGVGGVPSVVIKKGQGAQITGTETTATSNLNLQQPTLPSIAVCGTTGYIVPAGEDRVVDLNTESFCYTSIHVEQNATLLIIGDGDFAFTNVSGGSKALQVDGNASLYLTGDVTFLVEGVDIKSNLALGANAHLDLYATDTAGFKGMINESRDPAQLSIVYTGTSQVNINNATGFYGTIYALDAKVSFDNGSEVFGGVVSKIFDLGNQGQFHFDESLAVQKTTASNPDDPITVLSWRQL